MMTDPIADMLARLRNAGMAKHAQTSMPHSGIKVEIARILKGAGYIDDYKISQEGVKSRLTIALRYGPEGERVLSGIQRISRSGRRVYVNRNEIPQVLGGLGITIISTPQGMMTGGESRRRGLGGEVICNVW